MRILKPKFRKIESHKAPVRQLFRSLLRNTTHLPLAQPEIDTIRNQIVSKFQNEKHQMSLTQILLRLRQGYIWNDHMYNAIKQHNERVITGSNDSLNPKVESSSESLNWIKSQLKLYLEQLEQKQLEEHLNTKIPPTQDELARLQTLSRFTTARTRMLRSYKNNTRVSKKVELDNTYINSILVPEYFNRKQLSKTIQRKKVQTAKPRTAQIKFVPTAVGIMHFLRVPSNRPSSALSRIIRDGIHSNLLKNIDLLESMKVMARYEAEWEARLESNENEAQRLQPGSLLDISMDYSQSYKNHINEWHEPINESIRTIQKRINNKRKREKLHARTLVGRKRLIDASYYGKYRGNLWKWKKYDEMKQSSPLKFMVHYDVTKMM